jgi:hypothetical protein
MCGSTVQKVTLQVPVRGGGGQPGAEHNASVSDERNQVATEPLPDTGAENLMDRTGVQDASDDRRAAERDVEPLDLEAHVRLEAGLIDSLPSAGLVDANQQAPAPNVSADRHFSLWQYVKRFFAD